MMTFEQGIITITAVLAILAFTAALLRQKLSAIGKLPWWTWIIVGIAIELIAQHYGFHLP